ncbi:hypothetical protein Droror1_Dr00027249, partial [Drosera rotundifolia]
MQQKFAKRDGASIDQSRDIECLWQFYQLYKQRHRVDDIQEKEEKWRESGVIKANFVELMERKKVFSTLRALIEVMDVLWKDATPSVGRLVMEE